MSAGNGMLWLSVRGADRLRPLLWYGRVATPVQRGRHTPASCHMVSASPLAVSQAPEILALGRRHSRKWPGRCHCQGFPDGCQGDSRTDARLRYWELWPLLWEDTGRVVSFTSGADTSTKSRLAFPSPLRIVISTSFLISSYGQEPCERTDPSSVKHSQPQKNVLIGAANLLSSSPLKTCLPGFQPRIQPPNNRGPC